MGLTGRRGLVIIPITTLPIGTQSVVLIAAMMVVMMAAILETLEALDLLPRTSMRIVSIPINRLNQRNQNQRQRLRSQCRVCSLLAPAVAQVSTLCSAQRWKSQTMRLPPKSLDNIILSVLLGQFTRSVFKPKLDNNYSLVTLKQNAKQTCSSIVPTPQLQPQTESHEGVAVQPPKHNTFLLSDDYVIILATTQAAEVKYNIETESMHPLLVRNRFRTNKPVEEMDLSPGALQILHLPNAGGNSLESEVLSFELLHRCFGATLLKTEMEIEYFPEYSKKTDYSVTLHGHHVGVSVTRAMKFGSTFTAADADHLLRKKLFGIIVSSQNVLKGHKWEKQILHVWASHSYVADIVTEQFQKMSDSLRVDTLLVLTVCTSDSKAANVFTSNPAVFDYVYHSPPD